MSQDARLAGTLLVPLVFGGLFSLARFVAEGFDVPREEDYRAARAVLDEEGFSGERGDAVAVLPPWSLRAHPALRGLSPLSADRLHEAPLSRYRRLFLVVEPDAGRYLASLLARLPAPNRSRPVGRLEVLAFDLGSPMVRYDLRARVADAKVRIVDEQGAVRAACDRRVTRGLSCQGRPSWQRVTRQWLLVTDNGEDALWAHPPPAGEVLELTWPEVPLGDFLVLRAGHTRSGAERAKAPVFLEVLVGGERLARLERETRFHFRTDIVDTGRFDGRRSDVTLRIFTADNGGAHFAFDGFTATRRPADGEGQ